MKLSSTTFRLRCLGAATAALFTALPAVAADNAGATAARTSQRTDFLDAAYLPGLDRVLVAGHYGLIALVEVGDDSARMQLVPGVPNEDFTALEMVSDSEALIGASTGHLYRFDGTSLTQIAELSEYNEPILDIAADGDTVWVVGARGLLARSTDGETFEAVEISDVVMPQVEFPGTQAADWYFGVSNVNPDSIEFSGYVNGEPAVEEEHYIMFPDEGFVQFQTDFDSEPRPSVAFTFNPGPPFRTGDVSWNVVLLEGGTVTIAGEFGMILQSPDNGESWVRRDTQLVPREPEPAYWMAGVQQDERIWLTGAAGVSQRSTDGGKTWTDNPKPGREGIFGVTFTGNGTPLIAGAVGLIGFLDNNKWQIADRTRLKLLSWLKTPVALPDGSLLVMGGRATAIRYANGEFVRVPVTF